MEWTPDEIRVLAGSMEKRLDRPVSMITARTLRLVVAALRHYAADGFADRPEGLVIEVADLRHGTVGEVAAEVADLEAAEAVFKVLSRKRPGCRITLRKRGWVLRRHPTDDPPRGGAAEAPTTPLASR